MKQRLWILTAAVLLLVGITGCDREPKDLVNVISREDGSGTRGAFVELLGIQGPDENGEKIDQTTLEAVITNSTSVMLTLVSGDPNAVGYVSLGSLSENVKALAIDGVSPTIQSVKEGTYPVARPFNIVTGDALTPLAQDFIRFILSDQGQAVVEANGYVSALEGQAFAPAAPQPQGRLAVSGSSSVTPVMEKLAEAYGKQNHGAAIEIQQSDSTTGVNTVAEGISHIGMASRSLKESESQKGLKSTVIALDGIAIIVHNDNPLTGITARQAGDLFRGSTLFWSQVQG